MTTAEQLSPSEDFLRDLKALASHLKDAATALDSGARVYIEWDGERRLRGSDAEFGDSEQRRMQRNLKKAHENLRNAHGLSDGPPGWFSVRGMTPVDLWDSHLHRAIEEAMKLHARALGIAARALAERADGDTRCEEHAEGFRMWLDRLGDRAWNLRPADGDDPQAMTKPVLALAESAKRLWEVEDLMHQAWRTLDVSRMQIPIPSNAEGSTQTTDPNGASEHEFRSGGWFHKATGEQLATETLRKAIGDGRLRPYKVGGRWRYPVPEVKEQWPEHAPKIDAALALERKCPEESGTKRKYPEI